MVHQGLLSLHHSHKGRHYGLLTLILDDCSLEKVKLIKLAAYIAHQIIVEAGQKLTLLLALQYPVL